MTIIAIGSSDPKLDVFVVADIMEAKGAHYYYTYFCSVLPLLPP